MRAVRLRVSASSRFRASKRDDSGSLPAAVHRRPEAARRHRRRHSGLRVAEEDGRHLQGSLPVSRREDAVVPCQPRQGLLPLLRLRRRRRRLQVPRAAREGRLPGRGQAARAAVRHDAPGAGTDRRAARQRRRARDAAQGPRSGGGVVPASSSRRRPAPASAVRSPTAASPTRRAQALGLGFAPRARDALKQALLKQGFSQSVLLAGRPARAARRRRCDRPVPEPADDSDLPGHRLGHRVWRPRASTPISSPST